MNHSLPLYLPLCVYLEARVKDLESKIEKSNKLEERVVKVERSIYVLEKTKLGIEFCDFCEEEFQNIKDKNYHVRYTHTFICELCEVAFKTLEDLETDMHTCEKYDCDRCNLTLKTLSDVKQHCKSKHKNGADIFHFKFDRENKIKVTLKEYNSKEL